MLLWARGSLEKSQDPDEGPIADKEGQQLTGVLHGQNRVCVPDKLSLVTGKGGGQELESESQEYCCQRQKDIALLSSILNNFLRTYYITWWVLD